MHAAPSQVPTKRLAFSQPGLALEIAKQSIGAKGSKTHITDNAPRDSKFCPLTDQFTLPRNHYFGVRQLLTTGLWSSSSSR